MRFQEILEADVKLPEKTKTAFQDVYQNCQPFLQEIDNNVNTYPMYRGINGVDDNFGQKNVRLDGRRPLDTGQIEHDQLNDALEELYGHPYRNGLFVSGNYNVASGYGDLFAVFPIGKYEYIWHDTIDDLHSEVGGYDEAYDQWQEFAREIIDPKDVAAQVGADQAEDEEAWEDEYLQVVDDMIPDIMSQYGAGDLLKWVLKSKGDYRQTGLRTALGHPRKEIMIWVQSYYYMDVQWVPIFQKWLSK